MQSKRNSAFEAIANVTIGYLVSVAANILILPLFGYAVTVADSFGIGTTYEQAALCVLRCWVRPRAVSSVSARDGRNKVSSHA